VGITPSHHADHDVSPPTQPISPDSLPSGERQGRAADFVDMPRGGHQSLDRCRAWRRLFERAHTAALRSIEICLTPARPWEALPEACVMLACRASSKAEEWFPNHVAPGFAGYEPFSRGGGSGPWRLPAFPGSSGWVGNPGEGERHCPVVVAGRLGGSKAQGGGSRGTARLPRRLRCRELYLRPGGAAGARRDGGTLRFRPRPRRVFSTTLSLRRPGPRPSPPVATTVGTWPAVTSSHLLPEGARKRWSSGSTSTPPMRGTHDVGTAQDGRPGSTYTSHPPVT